MTIQLYLYTENSDLKEIIDPGLGQKFYNFLLLKASLKLCTKIQCPTMPGTCQKVCG